LQPACALSFTIELDGAVSATKPFGRRARGILIHTRAEGRGQHRGLAHDVVDQEIDVH
jgi:hypothetical protein